MASDVENGGDDGIVLSLDEARVLSVVAQRLDRRPVRVRDRGVVKGRLLETIRALGCVQLDTISVVARSHETVLWSRVGAYDPALLAELHFPDGELFEYWAHAAALVPIELFPFFRRFMAYAEEVYAGDGTWARANADVLERVLRTVRERGPVASRDFERPEGPRPAAWAWWGGKPDRRALDHLWTRGDLMVLKREGFQRVWEVTERVLPGELAGVVPTEAERRRCFVERALAALGVATPRWVADYFRSGSKPHVPLREAAAELAALEGEGRAVRVTIPGLAEPGPVWVAAEVLPRLAEVRVGRGRPVLTTLLSPFDSLVWHRGRALALFGFDYRLESYTPAPKRRYGYYTLPILHRGQLVGRLDPVYDRRGRVLTVKAVHLEPGVRPTEGLAGAVAGSLLDYVAFLGGGEVRVVGSEPDVFGAMVTESVRDRA